MRLVIHHTVEELESWQRVESDADLLSQQIPQSIRLRRKPLRQRRRQLENGSQSLVDAVGLTAESSE